MELKALEEAPSYLINKSGAVYRKDGDELHLMTPDAKGRVWLTLSSGQRTARSVRVLLQKTWDIKRGQSKKRGPSKALSAEQVEEIKTLQESMSLAAIGERYGVSPTTVATALGRKARRGRPRALSAEQVEEMKSLQDSMSTRELAERYGVTITTIFNYLS